MTAIGCRLSAIGCRLSAIGCRLSAVGCRLSAVGYPLSAVGWLYFRKQGGACGARVLWPERFPTRRSRHRHLERRYVPLWEADRNRSHDALSREISYRNAACTMRGGDFSTLWRLCIESPSQPKLASSLHNKRLSYWRLTGFGRNDGRAWAGFSVIWGGRFLHSASLRSK